MLILRLGILMVVVTMETTVYKGNVTCASKHLNSFICYIIARVLCSLNVVYGKMGDKTRPLYGRCMATVWWLCRDRIKAIPDQPLFLFHVCHIIFCRKAPCTCFLYNVR